MLSDHPGVRLLDVIKSRAGCIASALATLTAVWTGLLRLRLPFLVRAGRLWFAWCAFVAMTSCYVFSRAMTLLLPRAARERVNCVAVHFAMRLLVALNPQIRVRDSCDWSALPPKAMVIMPHTSWFDAILLSALLPWTTIQRSRGLFKSQLMDVPVGGSVFRNCGHFPVFFKKDEAGSWGVDARRQAPVTKAVEGFLEGTREPTAGYLCFYPEGTVNENPRELLSFRRGSFDWPCRYQLPIWALLTTGCQDVWPSKGKGFMGGSPADVDVELVEIVPDVAALPAEQQTKEGLSELCRLRAQEHLDRMYAARDARHSVVCS